MKRRKDTRYELHAAGSCRVPIDVRGQLWASAIIEHFETGLCLQSKKRFEPGSVVEIMVSVTPTKASSPNSRAYAGTSPSRQDLAARL